MRDLLGDQHKFYRIRVEGDDLATVVGILSNEDVEALTERCRKAEVDLILEPVDIPYGLDAVLDTQDESRAQDIRSILERREHD